MTKQAKVRGLVIGLLLAVGLGAPIASIVGNAPHRATARLDAAPATVTMPEMTIQGEYVPEVDVRDLPVIPAAHRAAKPAAKVTDGAPTAQTCRRVELEQQGIGYASYVTVCEG